MTKLRAHAYCPSQSNRIGERGEILMITRGWEKHYCIIINLNYMSGSFGNSMTPEIMMGNLSCSMVLIPSYSLPLPTQLASHCPSHNLSKPCIHSQRGDILSAKLEYIHQLLLIKIPNDSLINHYLNPLFSSSTDYYLLFITGRYTVCRSCWH